jgi:hypothetical protein
MNERIRELLKQASKLANTDDNKDFDRNFDMIVAEKFAQLIVQECISVINTEAAEVPAEDEYERMWKMGTEFAVYQIEKHFGVAESSAQAEQEAAEFIAAEDKKVASRYGYVPKLHPSEWKD